MKNVISAELYRARNSKLIWAASLFFILSTFYLYSVYDHPVFDAFAGAEFFVLPTIMSDTFPFAAAIVTAYLCCGNFAEGTIRNILSRGVGKREYYFSGLFSELGLISVFWGLSVAVHMICRTIRPAGNGWQHIDLFGWKLLILFVSAWVQMLACTAFFHMVSYFIKKQILSVVVCTLLVLVLAFFNMAADFYQIASLNVLMKYVPAWVLGNMFRYAIYDQILTFDFLQYIISGIFLTVLCSGIGFLKFYYADTDN